MEVKKRCINKKAQLTVFIILAIAIAVVFILLFVGKDKLIAFFALETPVSQIKRCVQEVSEEGVDILSLQGGSISPENYYLYEDNKVDYLCYNEEYYKRCVMQKPLLKTSIEEELADYIKPKVIDCAGSTKDSFEKKGYSVSYKEPEIFVELFPDNVLIRIELDLKFSKEGDEFYKEIRTDIGSKLYDFAIIASSILNNEARYGDSEIMDYMIYHPLLKVEKKKQAEGTKIYILTDRESREQFIFATRSVAIPPGLIGEEY